MRSFSTQEVSRKIIFPQYLRSLHDPWRTEKDHLSVLKKTIRWYFLLQYHVCWVRKISYFKIFGDGKYGLLLIQKVDVRWHFLYDGIPYLLNTEKFLFWTFRRWEMRSFFFYPKSSWKDDIYAVFLSFPWYSRTWEIWFLVQRVLTLLIKMKKEKALKMMPKCGRAEGQSWC